MTASPQSAASTAAGMNHRYLRVEELRRLRNLFFSSRRPVEGAFAGRHKSPLRGQSVEFNDYRPYTAGDDIGHIDWKLFGRTDRLYIKLFEHQSDMNVSLLVDGSASMHYAAVPGETTKFDHACLMAAAIAFLVTKQQDRIAFGVARDGLTSFHRAGSSFAHLAGILAAMEVAADHAKGDIRLPADQASRRADLPGALHTLGALAPKRGLVVLFSDLLDDLDPIFEAMSRFTHRGSEVIVFHVLHQDELDLPPLDEATFLDSETGRRVRLNVGDIRKDYAKQMRLFTDRCRTACRSRNIDYNLVSTATPYHQALERYLFTRAAML